MVILIISIISTIMVPSGIKWIKKMTIQSDSKKMITLFSLAKSYSKSLNKPIAIEMGYADVESEEDVTIDTISLRDVSDASTTSLSESIEIKYGIKIVSDPRVDQIVFFPTKNVQIKFNDSTLSTGNIDFNFKIDTTLITKMTFFYYSEKIIKNP